VPPRSKSTSTVRKTASKISPSFLQWLKDAGACEKAVKYCAKRASVKDAYDNCPDLDWLRWFYELALQARYLEPYEGGWDVEGYDAMVMEDSAITDGMMMALNAVRPKLTETFKQRVWCKVFRSRVSLEWIVGALQRKNPEVNFT